MGTGNLEFQPTKRWIRDHGVKPKECVCPDIPCYCIIDHFNRHAHGFCVGINPNDDDGLDMIRFCDRTYNPETNDEEGASRQWHPSEAQLVATYLAFAVINAWHLLPQYRNQLGKMERQRTRDIHKRTGE